MGAANGDFAEAIIRSRKKVSTEEGNVVIVVQQTQTQHNTQNEDEREQDFRRVLQESAKGAKNNLERILYQGRCRCREY